MDKKKKLNPVARKWVKALRSGKYKQGKHALHFEDTHCCLGVLEILAVEEGVQPELSDRKYLSPELRDWVGLKDSAGWYTVNGNSNSLSCKNDAGFSFSEIADIIESQPEGLFA